MKRALIVVGLLTLFGGAGLIWAQTTGINDREVQRFVVPGSNVTGFRVHSSGSTMNLTLAHGALRFDSRVGFANLPIGATNGTMLYCSNCTVADPCAAGGTGAFAKRIAGTWICN